MTDQHPITPPPELAAIWVAEIYGNGDPAIPLHPITLRLVERAAEWGYDQRSKVNEAELQQARDQELEACIEVIESGRWFANPVHRIVELRAARRPKPPSLKESALNALEHILRHSQTDHGANTIRRALEALPND